MTSVDVPHPRPRSMATQRLVLRALVAFEAVSTILGAVCAFVAPTLVVGSMIAGDLEPQAAAVVAQAAPAWTALGLLLLGSLMLGPADQRALRVLYVPILVGDVAHVGAIAWLVHGHGSWTTGAIGVAAFVVFVFAYRTVIVIRPERLLGAPPR